MKTAIFLGAGASAAEGAPIQSALFRKYFGSPRVQKHSPMYRDLAQFFKSIFNINLAAPLKKITFPTFEEALGVLDLAEAEKSLCEDLVSALRFRVCNFHLTQIEFSLFALTLY